MNQLINFLDNHLNFKRFFAFSVFIFPLAITLNLLPVTIWPQLADSTIFVYLFAYIIFAALNWIWSQSKLSIALILLSIVLGMPWLAFALNGFDNSKTLDIFSAAILYIIMLPVFLASQFAAWTPSVIKFYSETNKINIAVVVIILLFSIASYAGLGIITETIIGTPSFK